MAVEKFDYAEAARDAAELLEEFGQVGAIPRATSIPRANEWDPETTFETHYPITVVVLPIDLQNVGRDVDGTLIKSTDKQLLISAVGLDIEPTTTDRVLAGGAMMSGYYVGGAAYTIVRSNPLAPAGVVMLYDVIGAA